MALYLRAIKEQGLCPDLLKTDCEYENGDIAAVHYFLTGSCFFFLSEFSFTNIHDSQDSMGRGRVSL